MSKWDKWLSKQNDATRTYFENRMAEEAPFIYTCVGIGFFWGFVIATLLML